MTQIIIAIAALCTIPVPNRLSENDVLECQKYYVKCVNEKLKNNSSLSTSLENCILEKKKLGGNK